MVVRIVELAVLAPDDSPGAPVALARRDDRILPVVTPRLLGQPPLAVLEDAAVLIVGERPARPDQAQGGAGTVISGREIPGMEVSRSTVNIPVGGED